MTTPEPFLPRTEPDELMERFGVCHACAHGESADDPEACTCAPDGMPPSLWEAP